MEDEQIVNCAINGDDDAFLILMNTHRIALYKTALAYLRNEDDALEAVQEVTFRAYTKISTVREPDYIKTWLIRIMINYCNDTLKMKKKVILNETVLDTRLCLQSHDLMEVLDAMNALDEQSKELINLKYFQDIKIKEIASVMNRPEGTIKTWLNRALTMLRKHLREMELGENVPKRRNKAK